MKTSCPRLVAKNVVAHEADGRRYLYRPLVEREAYVANESQRLVDRLFGGRVTPLVAHLAEDAAAVGHRHRRDRGPAEGAQAMIAWLVETLVATTGLMVLVLLIRNPVRQLFGSHALMRSGCCRRCA